jgi:hypothetical protein
VIEIVPGIWRWTARHPEWHPGEFGAEVASFALTCAKRLRDESLLSEDTTGPAGVTVYGIGRPRRSERPIWIPSHGALAFGDALVANPRRELRIWVQHPVDDRIRSFYRDRFAPTLDPLLELPVEHVLVTHDEAVTGDGAQALREAAASEPWYHRG